MRSYRISRYILSFYTSTYRHKIAKMPAFFDSIKRKSRSFRTDRSTSAREERSDSSTGGSHELNTDASTTTVNSSIGSTTPPLSSPTDQNSQNGQKEQKDQKNGGTRRPNVYSNSSRFSVSGMSGLGSPVVTGSSAKVSPYAPRVYNMKDGACVGYFTFSSPAQLC